MGMQYFGSEFGWPQYLIDKFANPYIPKTWLGTFLCSSGSFSCSSQDMVIIKLTIFLIHASDSHNKIAGECVDIMGRS